MLNTPNLLPGDCLLYSPKGIFGWIISIKTWNPIAHVEVYIGDGYSVASRDGIGVGVFPVRLEGLAYVYRPNRQFDINKALQWYLTKAKGQKYDWLGLLRFAWRSKVVPDDKDNRQFCSEFATRFYREGGLDLFNSADADSIPPSYFLVTPLLDKIWSAK